MRFLRENWLWIVAPIVIVLGLIWMASQKESGTRPAEHTYEL